MLAQTWNGRKGFSIMANANHERTKVKGGTEQRRLYHNFSRSLLGLGLGLCLVGVFRRFLESLRRIEL